MSKGFHSALGKGAADGQDGGTRNTHLPGNHPIGVTRLGAPCAASRITRQRRATRCIVLPACARVSKVVLTSLLILTTMPGLNIHPAYNIDHLWSVLKCYVTLEEGIAFDHCLTLAWICYYCEPALMGPL
jgi:hypothetical protein